MLVNENDKLLHYYYEVKDFYFTINKQKCKMHDLTLKSFSIVNDYVTNLFPIICIRVAMDAKMYYKIIKSKSDVKVKMKIQKYTRESSKKGKSLNTAYIDETFDLILDDDDEDMYEDVRNKNHKGQLKDDELFEQVNEVEFFLFKKKTVNITKKRINKIFKKATVADAIGYIATKIGLDNLLMTPPTNDKEYSEFIIPPLKASDAIRYIDTYYGIYNVGMILFFGIERSYLIPYEAKCTAYERNEEQNVKILIPKAGSPASQHLCGVKKPNDNNIYVIGDYETIQFENRSTTGKLTKAEDIHVIHSAAQHDQMTPGKLKNKRMLINRGYSRYLGKIYRKRLESLNTVITVEFNDVDLSIFRPNKRFSFIFEDTKLNQKYAGKYLLLYSEFCLAREKKDLVAVAKCVLYRTS